MKVLMVCLGNICRSPMAEGILRARAASANKKISIDSAGTANYHAGEHPDSRAVKCMKKHGHDISLLKARQFNQRDFDQFDIIFAMDQSNLDHLLGMTRNLSDKKKVQLFLGQIEGQTDTNVPDPYYGSMEDFEHVYGLLLKASDHFLKNRDHKMLP